ncbi:hypothetical protein HPB51_012516 [Rhipicephalus microplus]|uniref:CCHC-type domain-containing protein n=1 Tax=Rhipicephalus microplus TaxID=6941 RepID=A0A9J6DGJ7_RHIMP|nr:hypothetical protein HPB51_012516 [Rhipicephalus microplus]
MVLTFCGKRVPFFVNAYGQALRCYLCKRTIPHCRKCNKTGHREDVCPQPPDTPKCRVCGDSLSPNSHEGRPSCMLCGGDHPTAAKPCPKRFLPPVNRRKPPRSATPTKKVQSPSPSPGRQSSASGSVARRRSHSRDKSGPKRGNTSSRSGFAGQPGSQGWHTDGTTHHHGQQSGSHKKAQTVVRFPLGSCIVYEDCSDCLQKSEDPLKCGWCDDRCAHSYECPRGKKLVSDRCPIIVSQTLVTSSFRENSQVVNKRLMKRVNFQRYMMQSFHEHLRLYPHWVLDHFASYSTLLQFSLFVPLMPNGFESSLRTTPDVVQHSWHT